MYNANCIRASIRIVQNLLHTTICLWDTDAQPSLVAKSFIPALWMIGLRKKHSLNLSSATNDPIVTLVQVELFRRLVDLYAKTIFNMAETLSVRILIRTRYMSKYVTSMHPTEKQVRPLR